MRVDHLSPARGATTRCPGPAWITPCRLFLLGWLAFSLAIVSITPDLAQTPASACGDQDRAAADQQLSAIKLLVQGGRYPDAEAKLRDYIRSHETCAEAHVLLGLVKFNQDLPAESLAEFSLAARITPPGPAELVIVALDYLKLKDLLDADKWMTAALEKAPANAPAWRYLGGIKYAENRFAEAIAAYRRCLQLQPEDVLAQDGLGRSYEGLKQDEDALAAYRRALDMQSHARTKHAEPLLHLGTLLLHQAQADEAIPLLQSAEKIDAADPDVHQHLGEAYTQVKQFDKAETELQTAIELSPHEAHLHWLLASVYRKQGQTEKADKEARIFGKALSSDSSDKVR